MRVKPMLGEFELDGIEYLESVQSRALIEHRVPGLEGNYLQDMGSVPNTITIVGSKFGDDARDNFLNRLRELFNSSEPTTFVADINTATDLTEVVIEDLQVAEVGGSTNSFHYRIRLRKYTRPPEPPQTGLLDNDILNGALDVVNALDALDSFATIPNFGNPTAPLRQILDGLRSATSGLDDVRDQLAQLLG